MSWFKVDDGLSSHPKVLQIPRAVRAEALGLWVLAGTWSARHKTDGRIPLHIIDELAGTDVGARALVDVRLWRRVSNGYQFVNWAEFQPTREKLAGQTEYEREKKRRQRAAKAQETGEVPTSVPGGQSHVPPLPSQSRPDPKNDQSSGDLDSEQPGAGSTGENPVQSVDNDLERIAARAVELTGRPVHPLEAADIRRHYLDRASSPPRLPTRYVLTCLTREEPLVLLNYLDTGRWSA